MGKSGFFEYIFEIEKVFGKPEVSINGLSGELVTSFSFQINKEYDFHKNVPSSFFGSNDVKLYIESVEIISPEELVARSHEASEYYPYEISIIFNQKVISERFTEFFFYNEESLLESLKVMSKSFSIRDIQNIKGKINLVCTDYIIPFESSIFTLNSQKKDLLEDFTVDFISSLPNTDVSLFIIPNSLDFSLIKNVDLNFVLQGQLEQLANNQSNNLYRFIGKSNLVIDMNNTLPVSSQQEIYKILQETLIYMFESVKSSDQKLTFYRKCILDGISKDTTYKLVDTSASFFKNTLHETEIIYDSYQDGEISIFLKEKKEIIKEYMSISQETMRNVNVLKSNMLRNLITLIVLFISNIALKSKGVTDINDSRIILYSALIFIIIIISVFFINDKPIKSNIDERLAIFKLHFNFISSHTADLKTAVETAIKKEVKVLNNLLTFSITLYFLIFLFVLFEISSSFSHELILDLLIYINSMKLPTIL